MDSVLGRVILGAIVGMFLMWLLSEWREGEIQEWWEWLMTDKTREEREEEERILEKKKEERRRLDALMEDLYWSNHSGNPDNRGDN